MLKNLHAARQAVENAKAEYEASLTPEQKAAQERLEAAKTALKAVEGTTRAELQKMLENGEPLPAGASVRQVTRLQYKPELQIIWCVNQTHLTYLKLDTQKFEADIKAGLITPPNVSIDKQPQITIASDLSVYYGEECPECCGSGECSECNGSGKTPGNVICVQCSGTGSCPHCRTIKECERCDGTGVLVDADTFKDVLKRPACPDCNGTGYITE